jgi:hypothetical protein
MLLSETSRSLGNLRAFNVSRSHAQTLKVTPSAKFGRFGEALLLMATVSS